MLRKLLFAMALCAPVISSTAAADEVVKWVDEDGITHFGNAQFAPSGAGEMVNIKPANGMDPTDLSILQARKSSRPMNMTTLNRPVLENPRGFRGFHSRSRNNNSRRRSSLRR